MPDANDRTLAFDLEKAKESLEGQIGSAVRAHRPTAPEPIEVVVAFEKSREISPDQGDEGLIGTIRQLVEAFHRHSAVTRSGVRVRQVTALDSDGDGQAAVNVKYAYDL